MKTVTELANILGVSSGKIASTIKQQGIICDVSLPKRRINEFQEDIIQKILIFEGKIDGYIYESKMNKEESFTEFKKRTYGIRY